MRMAGRVHCSMLRAMNSRCLFALLVLGCSSSTHTAKKTLTDNGTANSVSDSGTYSGDNSNCPAWPADELFPSVGPFFYGPDKGPCSSTQTDRSGAVAKSFTVSYTYNADGMPTLAQTAAGTTLVHRIEYVYSQGLLNKTTDFAEGLQSKITYSYADSAASYLVVDSAGRQFNYQFTLDGNGYPQTIDCSTSVDGSWVPSEGIAKYVFRYNDCKIQERAAFAPNGEPYLKSTATFSYDDTGHVVDVSAPDFEITYDYSCWLPQDAGTN